MGIENKDFVELEFSGRIKNGELFDTTKKEDAKELNIEEDSLRPLIICIGQEMVVPGLDIDLVGKDLQKEYFIEISAKDAFGKRDPNLVQMVPLKNFAEQKIMPEKGMQFSFDGKLARILSVSGGRVLVDFNNNLAGKDIVYKYKILRKIEDKVEQFGALQEFFFRKKFESHLENDKLIIKVDKKYSQLIELMKKRFEEVLGKEIVIGILDKN
jgi:FKBP-type peptidyl-prolyl cis-trans isomerase 2